MSKSKLQMTIKIPKLIRLKLKGKAVVFVDWANVYGWNKSLKREIESEEVFRYLKSYPEIVDIRLYFGEDEHPKSKIFLRNAMQTGYSVISKPVKRILVDETDGLKVYRRKCDFDMETCIDAQRFLKDGYTSFIFFTGDGDYEPLYKLLIEQHKQVIVVYVAGHLGREIWEIKKGLFKVQIGHLLDI